MRGTAVPEQKLDTHPFRLRHMQFRLGSGPLALAAGGSACVAVTHARGSSKARTGEQASSTRATETVIGSPFVTAGSGAALPARDFREVRGTHARFALPKQKRDVGSPDSGAVPSHQSYGARANHLIRPLCTPVQLGADLKCLCVDAGHVAA